MILKIILLLKERNDFLIAKVFLINWKIVVSRGWLAQQRAQTAARRSTISDEFKSLIEAFLFKRKEHQKMGIILRAHNVYINCKLMVVPVVVVGDPIGVCAISVYGVYILVCVS